MSQYNKCLFCNKEITGKNHTTKKYCSRECYKNAKEQERPVCPNCGKHIGPQNWIYCSAECSKVHRKATRNTIILNEWLNNDLSNCLVKSGPQIGELQVHVKENIIKPYLLEKQEYKCGICGQLNMHNNQPLVFILDHIDGDWSNNYKTNFRLICPNCNSQLETTKNNKGKGRYSARLYQKQHRDNLK